MAAFAAMTGGARGRPEERGLADRFGDAAEGSGVDARLSPGMTN